MTSGVGSAHKMLSIKHGVHESCCGERHTLPNKINELLLAFSLFIQFGKNLEQEKSTKMKSSDCKLCKNGRNESHTFMAKHKSISVCTSQIYCLK